MATALLVAAQPLAAIAISGLWQGLLLLGAVALLLRALPTGSASTRAALWATAFGLAVLVPFLHLRSSTLPGTPLAGTSLHLGPAAECAIVALWLLLSGVRAIQLLRETLHLRRIAQASTPFSTAAPLRPLLLIGRRTLELRSSTAVDSPCVLGFFRPRLLLPAHAVLSTDDLHAVLLHEREHLLRHDDWTNLFQRLALVLFPLNPALTLIDRRLGAERELACDAAVVARTAQPLRYAGVLTRLAEQRLHLRSVALSLSGWARRSELTRRVETLLRPATAVSPRRSRLAAGTVAAALCAGSAALARAPQLVSFTSSSAAVSTAAALPASSTMLPALAIPAAFHPSDQPRAILLRATLPASPAPVKPVHRSPATQRTRRVQPPRAVTPSTPRAVLTSTRASSTPGFLRARTTSGARAIVLTTDLPSFAAVPFAGGWLVIQL